MGVQLGRLCIVYQVMFKMKRVIVSPFFKILMGFGVIALHFIIIATISSDTHKYNIVTEPEEGEFRNYTTKPFCLSHEPDITHVCPSTRPMCRVSYIGKKVYISCSYPIPSVVGQGMFDRPFCQATLLRTWFQTIRTGIWAGFLNVFTNIFLLKTARLSFDRWYSKVRFLQRANVFSSIAASSYDVFCTNLFIDYLRYANFVRVSFPVLNFYRNQPYLNQLPFLKPDVRESLALKVHEDVHRVFMLQAIESVVIAYCVVMQLITYSSFQLFVGKLTKFKLDEIYEQFRATE